MNFVLKVFCLMVKSKKYLQSRRVVCPRFTRSHLLGLLCSRTSSPMPLPTHLPHVIYATALTSIALHLLSTRKAGAAAKQQADARISLLDGLATRLRAGERVSADDLGRVRRLLRGGDADDAGAGVIQRMEATEKDVDWKATVLGRRDPQAEEGRRKGEERVERELNAGES